MIEVELRKIPKQSDFFISLEQYFFLTKLVCENPLKMKKNHAFQVFVPEEF